MTTAVAISVLAIALTALALLDRWTDVFPWSG